MRHIKSRIGQLVLLVLAVSPLLFPQASMAYQEKKTHGEASIGGIYLFGWDEHITLFTGTIGVYGKSYGLEARITPSPGTLLFGGNLVGSIDAGKASLFVTGGVLTSFSGGLAFTLGGGVKAKIAENIALRAEYLYWFIGDEGGINSIGGSVVFSF